MSSVDQEEGQKESLPVNHPQAGYVSPAKDTLVNTGTVPEAEQEAWDERVAANEEEKDAVEEAEHEAATADDPDAPPPEGGEGEGEGEGTPAKSQKPAQKTGSSSSASSSS